MTAATASLPVHVVRAPLRGEVEAVWDAGVLVVDDRLTPDVVEEARRQAHAYVAGDLDAAPNVVRPRPTLRLIPGGRT